MAAIKAFLSEKRKKKYKKKKKKEAKFNEANQFKDGIQYI